MNREITGWIGDNVYSFDSKGDYIVSGGIITSITEELKEKAQKFADDEYRREESNYRPSYCESSRGCFSFVKRDLISAACCILRRGYVVQKDA